MAAGKIRCRIAIVMFTAVALLSVPVIVFDICTISDDSSAENGDVTPTMQWDLFLGTLTITGSGDMPDYDPSGTGLPWNTMKNEIVKVVIGDGVTKIGDYSFYQCINLTSVDFGFTVTTIGHSSFEGCTSILSLYFPDSLTSIGETAFGGCLSINDVSFGPLAYIDGNAFSGNTIVGMVGPINPLNVGDLYNNSFSRNALNNNLEYSGHCVYYNSKGGSFVDWEIVYDGNYANEPAPYPTRTGYDFNGWYSDYECNTPYVFENTSVNNRLLLYADWAAIPYTITYNTYGGNIDTTSNPVTYTIETVLFDLNPPEDRPGYSFIGWFLNENGGNPITQLGGGDYGDVTLYAHWVQNATHDVRFISDGTVVQTSSLSEGATIIAPSDPVKDSDSKYDYTFVRWDGFTSGMTMNTEGREFTAVFQKSARINYDPQTARYSANVDLNDGFITKSKIDSIIDKAKSDGNVTMAVTIGDYTVTFDNAALRSLKSADASLSVNKKAYSDLSDAEKKIAGVDPVFDISFGENTDFGGGKVTITVPHEIRQGKNADDLYVGYINGGKIAEELECTYEDGKVTFSTGHLSVYTLLYKESKKTDFFANLSFSEFLSIGIILSLALAAIVYAVLKKIK